MQERREAPPAYRAPAAKVESQDTDTKEVCNAPLDLSNTGRPRPKSPDIVPIEEVMEEGEEEEREEVMEEQEELMGESGGDGSAEDTPESLPVESKATVKKEEATSDANHKLMIKHVKQKDEMKSDNGKKVPVLTISLRPVVVLESLNSALQKQESSSSNQNSPEGGSSSEKDEDEGENRSVKRKRTTADSEPDNLQQEQKIKIPLRNEHKRDE